ncbi:MAG: hypothetical protein CL816_04495 [Coxiellaceae bacterium]|mgnify:CR=1 FL=1|nr:hypothetical protein [Coxiellaceae bacterium]|tara:strand:+ start:2446 stop:4059 length:1614 start_codon:yes stop_codon:yes gene_type:complete
MENSPIIPAPNCTSGLWPPLDGIEENAIACTDAKKLEIHIEYETKLAFLRARCMSMLGFPESMKRKLHKDIKNLVDPINNINIEKKNVPRWLYLFMSAFRAHKIDEILDHIEILQIDHLFSIYRYCYTTFVESNMELYQIIAKIRDTILSPEQRLKIDMKKSKAVALADDNPLQAYSVKKLDHRLRDMMYILNRAMLRYSRKEWIGFGKIDPSLEKLSALAKDNDDVTLVNTIHLLCLMDMGNIKGFCKGITEHFETKINDIIKGLIDFHTVLTHYPIWFDRHQHPHKPSFQAHFNGLKTSINSSSDTIKMLKKWLNDRYPVFSELINICECKAETIGKKTIDGPHALDHIISEIKIPGLQDRITKFYSHLLESDPSFLEARITFLENLTSMYQDQLTIIREMMLSHTMIRCTYRYMINDLDTLITSFTDSYLFYKSTHESFHQKSENYIEIICNNINRHDNELITFFIRLKIFFIGIVRNQCLSLLDEDTLNRVTSLFANNKQTQHSFTSLPVQPTIWQDDVDQLTSHFESMQITP